MLSGGPGEFVGPDMCRLNKSLLVYICAVWEILLVHIFAVEESLLVQ